MAPASRRERLRLLPGRLAVALVIGWLGVMAAAGLVLADSQAGSRRAVAARVQARTGYAASFISIYARDLLARERAAAQSWFATPRVGPDALARTASALGLRAAVLFDANGHPIVTLPSSSAAIDGVLARRYARLSVSGGDATGAGASNISMTKVEGPPIITFAVAYRAPSGRRVFSGAYTVSDTVLPNVLDHLLSTPGWHASVVDSHGGSLSAGLSGGPRGAQVYFTAPVVGTSWRIVVRDPEAQLYGFLYGAGRWVAWLALTGLTGAGLAIIILIARLARRRTQLTALNAELARLAAADALTGLRNRRAIEEYLHDALSAARRHDLALSLLVVDVDHFKNFNDMLGHRSGDAVLAHTARVLNGALRAEDAIGRWGGEEFLVVLPGTDEEGALHATDRLREALAADQPEEARLHGLPVTITIGVAEWGHEAIDELVTRADSALYLGKAAGRDTVQVSRTALEIAEAIEPA
jgi:diguanylate cyclase (GGDEF)-like protein